MLTKAIILGKELNSNQYTVRIPLLETSASKEIFKTKATLCADDGVLNPFNIDDVVYVSFEDDLYENPVILGKLSLEGLMNKEREPSNVSYLMNSLQVTTKAELPVNTKVGDISYGDLSTLFRKASDIDDKIANGYNDKDIGIYMNNHILRIYLYNFTEADIGKKIQLFRTTHHTSKGFKHPEKYGYGVVADKVTPSIDIPVYPEVPLWMPNDGFIQTEWTITQEMISTGYFEIDWKRDWVCLVIPHWNSLDEEWDWLENSSIFGTAGSRGSVKMKFGVVNGDTLQFLSTGTLYLGSCYSAQAAEEMLTYVEDGDYYILNVKRIYKSVK